MEDYSTTTWCLYESDFLKSRIENELEAFLELGHSWSVMNEGVPISREVTEQARDLYLKLRNLNFDKFEVQPGLSGGVLLIALKRESIVDIFINDNGTYEFYLEKNGEEKVAKTDLGDTDLISELKNLEETWNTSESLTHNTTASSMGDIQALPFNLPQQTEESPFLKSIAQYRIVDQFATT